MNTTKQGDDRIGPVLPSYRPHAIGFCPCGCGEPVQSDERGRPRKYAARGHNLRLVDNYTRTGAPNPFTGRHHTAETRAILSEKATRPKPWISGERNGMHGKTGAANPNWRGGGSPERQRLYATGEGREFLRSVRRRDEFRCVECGSTRQLHVHHLRGWAAYPAGRLDPDNAITLCREHHIARHSKGGDANE